MIEIRISFKEMCERFGVTPRTLRYYEYIELLSPEREGRSRFYSAREVARMTLIMRGRRFGFSLEEIRQWLEIYDQQGTRAQMEAWVVMADSQLADLRKRQEELAQTIAELEGLRADTSRSLEECDREQD
ncbi:MerR family DNA-binding transcriptional regulator [Roseicyclus sp. F158]|uniref:MerR family DNA-binding transcriptional regulator n=1 Tax=Tropicimonas omnivorans TaxID=3075590 RepID=A0ABU3DG57_9RHOB|nr:MerR family DNA-binding transcriptional regulator [Roseicyclus sp. F158]MDT0682544.1 MerR family DNA-binding transcriptional regulator [Roseicyclus sp. F158]